MKGRSYILKVSGERVPVEPKNGTDFSLEELKKAIGGGYIEVVRLGNKVIMVIDEEGKLKKGMMPNVLASRLYNAVKGFTNPDIIMGDALICNTEMVK